MLLEPATRAVAEGVDEIGVPDTVIGAPPVKRVWLPMRKRQEESSVTTEFPIVRTETGVTIGETVLGPGTTMTTKPFTSVVMEDDGLGSVWIDIALLSKWRELEEYAATFVPSTIEKPPGVMLSPLTYTTVATELVSGALAPSLA